MGRGPKMSSLLFAHQDVCGDDEMEYYQMYMLYYIFYNNTKGLDLPLGPAINFDCTW